MKNYVDKIVDVENKGKSDSYIRTIFAVPTAGQAADTWLKLSWNDGTNSKWSFERLDNELVNIDGVEYRLYVATYKEPLKGSESNNSFDKVTTPALFGLYMDSAVDFEGTDGNNGYYTWDGKALVGDLGTTKVLVATQAVQVAGFEPDTQVSAGTADTNEVAPDGHLASAKAALKEAFGDISKNNHPWNDSSKTWTGTANTEWYTADTSKTEYEISTAAQLAGLAQLVNSGTEYFAGKTIKLADDIDLSGKAWTPIGKELTKISDTQTVGFFCGTFNGNGKTISNLTIHNSGDTATGLFGYIASGSVVTNLTVRNANVNAHHHTGVIAGNVSGKVTSCKVYDSVVNCTCVDARGGECGDKAGAIVGHLVDGNCEVSSCYAENVQITAGRDAGYIVGSLYTNDIYDHNSASNCTVSSDNICPEKGNLTDDLYGRVITV